MNPAKLDRFKFMLISETQRKFGESSITFISRDKEGVDKRIWRNLRTPRNVFFILNKNHLHTSEFEM